MEYVIEYVRKFELMNNVNLQGKTLEKLYYFRDCVNNVYFLDVINGCIYFIENFMDYAEVCKYDRYKDVVSSTGYVYDYTDLRKKYISHIPSSTGYSPANYAIYELLDKYRHCTSIDINNIINYDRYQLASYVVNYMIQIPLAKHVGLDNLSLVKLLQMINKEMDPHIAKYLSAKTGIY